MGLVGRPPALAFNAVRLAAVVHLCDVWCASSGVSRPGRGAVASASPRRRTGGPRGTGQALALASGSTKGREELAVEANS